MYICRARAGGRWMIAYRFLALLATSDAATGQFVTCFETDEEPLALVSPWHSDKVVKGSMYITDKHKATWGLFGCPFQLQWCLGVHIHSTVDIACDRPEALSLSSSGLAPALTAVSNPPSPFFA